VVLSTLLFNATSDAWYELRGNGDGEAESVELMDGPEAVRLFKFVSVTLIAIVVTHTFVRWVGWENDVDYTLSDFVSFDLNYVLLDVLSFFLVGRLYRRRGFDCLFPYILPMILGAIYPSWTTDWSFLRHSFSIYDIVCDWPWQLFLYSFLNVALAATVVGMHVRTAHEDGTLLSRSLEALVLFLFFIFPYLSDPNFYLHRWYLSWLLGMQLNQDHWLSKSALAFLWGQYVNGIAVYGRDPILTCAYGYYIGTDIRCPYMECIEEVGHPDAYMPFVAPDWRNCSASGNHVP